MKALLFSAILTAFISSNGNVVAVDLDSTAYQEYIAEADTDIGDNTINESTLSKTAESSEDETGNIDNDTLSVSDGDSSDGDSSVTYLDTTEMVSLLSDTVELLSENSSTVTGTVNTTVLDMCDRIIDDYPSHYKYAAFRIDSDDSYRTTLYIAKKATYDNGTITFSDDCIAVNFYRTTTSSGYTGYIYYNVSDAPSASVYIGDDSIVYTNVIDGYPTLGNKTPTNNDWLYIMLLVIILVIVIVK